MTCVLFCCSGLWLLLIHMRTRYIAIYFIYLSLPCWNRKKKSSLCGDVLQFRCYVLTGGKVIVWSVVGWTRSSAYPLEFLCYEVRFISIVYSLIILLWNQSKFLLPPNPRLESDAVSSHSLCFLCNRRVAISSFLCVVLNFFVTVCLFEWLDVIVPLQA